MLIALACVLVVRAAAAVPAGWPGGGRAPTGTAARCCTPACCGAGVYGGYFGAAQGVLLIALMGLLLDEDLQRINAAKNVLAGLVNLVAAVVFIAVTDVAWEAAGLIAARLRRRRPARGPDRAPGARAGAARRSSCLVGVVAIVALMVD